MCVLSLASYQDVCGETFHKCSSCSDNSRNPIATVLPLSILGQLMMLYQLRNLAGTFESVIEVGKSVLYFQREVSSWISF